MITAYTLEQALEEILGETEEEPYSEWWSEYTGLNGFYHLLSGQTGYDATNTIESHPAVTKNGDVVTVEPLGDFKKIEVFEHDFSTYEGTAQTSLVFEFDGRTFRITSTLDSHAGGVWNTRLKEVKPVEKTIRVWDNV